MKLSRKVSLTEPILKIQFILLCTVLSPFTIAGKNILFMGFSAIGAILLFLLNKRFPVNISMLLYVLLLTLCASYLINFTETDHFSFLYSLFFICSFAIFTSYDKQKIESNTFRRLLLTLLSLYLVMLLVGQLYVLFGFFKGTYITTGLVHGQFGTLYEAGFGFRFYSLSSEPSYAAFIIICTLYVILELDPEQRPFTKKNLYAWLATLYLLFSFQSGYGVILFGILVLFKMKFRNILAILTIGLIVMVVLVIAKQPAVARVTNILANFRLDQFEEIKHIDHSASFRILPTYYYVKSIDLMDLHFLFGHGAGQSSKFLIPFLFDVIVDDYEGGFMPQFIFDYGIIFFAVFLYFLKKEVLTSFISFETAVLLMLLTNANFNTQLFWIVITIFSLHKFYKKSSFQTSTLQNLSPIVA
jgi:hypothetical protein